MKNIIYFIIIFLLFSLGFAGCNKGSESGLCIPNFCPKDKKEYEGIENSEVASDKKVCGKCPDDFDDCNIDQDCILVQNDCCKYPATLIAINKKYVEIYNEWRLNECKEIASELNIECRIDDCLAECKPPIYGKCSSQGFCGAYPKDAELKEWEECVSRCRDLLDFSDTGNIPDAKAN